MLRELRNKSDLSHWDPENKDFWQLTAKQVAKRNLWISIPALLLGFAVWFIWSIVVVKLNDVGFHFTNDQLFTIASMPGLVGATLRILYSFTVPIFGGRNWTVFSTAVLLVPAILMGYLVQNLSTSYSAFLFVGSLCGLGGGIFSSSMANISFFFPRHEQGTALGLNAGLGNLGVSLAQFLLPIVIGYSMFGTPQEIVHHGIVTKTWLQNAGYIWVIPIIVVTLLAWYFMDNLPTAKISLKSQFVIFKRKHMYLTTILYIMSFGSYIGYSAAFPLLIKTQFTTINALYFAFLGPMVGALVRPIGGIISDKLNSGARVTFWSVIIMIGAVFGVIYFIGDVHKSFIGFFILFMVLFITTGVANGSVFRMIGVIFPVKEKAPALGFSAAIAAYGAFLLPQLFGFSIKMTGHAAIAFYGFIAFYLICLFIVWYFYSRKTAKTQC